MHEIADMRYILGKNLDAKHLPVEVTEMIPLALEVIEGTPQVADALCDAIDWYHAVHVVECDDEVAMTNYEKRLNDAKELLGMALVKKRQYAEFRDGISNREGFDHRYGSFIDDVRAFADNHEITLAKAMEIIQDLQSIKQFYNCVEIDMYFAEWYFKGGK